MRNTGRVHIELYTVAPFSVYLARLWRDFQVLPLIVKTFNSESTPVFAYFWHRLGLISVAIPSLSVQFDFEPPVQNDDKK